MNLGAPRSSRVLSKGTHEGPALTAQEASKILGWIEAEHDARPPATIIETMQVMMTSGSPATIALDSIGLAGATITFTAQPLQGDLYVTGLTVNPGADGVHLEHPLFMSDPPGAPRARAPARDRAPVRVRPTARFPIRSTAISRRR